MAEPPVSILVLVPSLTVGGTERHLLTVLPRLDRARFAVEVATTRGPGRLDEDLRQAGIPVTPAPVRFAGKANVLAAAPGLIARFRKAPPDIAHFFLPEAYLLGGPVSRLSRRTRRIMSRRSLNRYQRGQPLARRLEGWLHQAMDAIVGNSQAVMAELAAEGAPPERLVHIANGIEVARFGTLGRDEARAGFADELVASGDDALVLVMLATLLPYKGHHVVLEALGAIAPELPAGWRLLLAGRDEGIGEALRRQAAALGIAENIRFLGELAAEAVPRLLSAGDIGLLASHEEGFPNAALECLASRLPMVVTAAGGAAEVVEMERSGLVVPPGDPEALGRALLTLAQSPRRRAAMGLAGRARVEARFSIERCVADYERLYDAVARGDPLPGAGTS